MLNFLFYNYAESICKLNNVFWFAIMFPFIGHMIIKWYSVVYI